MNDRQIDWSAIQADYENGSSLRTLASKYGVSKSVIGDRKYKEHWDQKRTSVTTQDVQRPDMNAAVRAATGFRLRYESRLTWEEVATQAGYSSRGAAKHAVDREAQRHVIRDIDETRDIESHRLSQLQDRCYKAGMSETNDDWTWAIDRYIALSKRKSELMGLDVKPDAIPGGVTVIREYGVEVSRV